MMRCLTSALICSSARSSRVIASTVELMDSTPSTIGGRMRSCPARRTTSSIFHGAKPVAVMRTVYLPGGTTWKEKAPVSSERVVTVVLLSMPSRAMRAPATVASVASVTVPEMTERPGASGSCEARVAEDWGCARSRATQRTASRDARESVLQVVAPMCRIGLRMQICCLFRQPSSLLERRSGSSWGVC